MVKQRDIQYFTANVNGREITFRCYTTWTRNGFCHTAVCTTWGINTTPTKQSYINRTWERFTYESVLIRAIEKLRKELRAEVHAQLIDHKAAEEHEKAEAFVKAFSTLHDSLSDENKKKLAESDIQINTEGDAKAVMGMMALMKVMQS